MQENDSRKTTQILIKMMLASWVFHLLPSIIDVAGIYLFDYIKAPYKGDALRMGLTIENICSFISINMLPSIYLGGLQISVKEILFCRICKKPAGSIP